jgi:hypothetical protein
MMAVLRRTVGVAVCVGLFLGTTACETAKSANPLSPTLAGPMEGVSITAPKALEPWANQQIKDNEQPFNVVIENASSSSPRPFKMRMQIATDSGFASVVWAHDALEPGEGGQTRFRMWDRLQAGRQYYWRVMADDGANKSDWSSGVGFQVLMPAAFGAPSPRFPVANALVSSPRPELAVANGQAQGPVGQAFYLFQVSTDSAFGRVVVNEEVPQQGGETKLTVPGNLPYSTTFFWRVRVSDGDVIGPWSATEYFRTGVAPPPPPGGPAPGSPVAVASCGPPWPSNGDAIVGCVMSKYPEKLLAVASLEIRIANMEFLRNRVIEVGICGGLDLAWNLKRGVGPHSIDAIAWKHPSGFVDVVDIGTAYDFHHQPLELWWGIVAGPPGYDPYSPRPSC